MLHLLHGKAKKVETMEGCVMMGQASQVMSSCPAVTGLQSLLGPCCHERTVMNFASGTQLLHTATIFMS